MKISQAAQFAEIITSPNFVEAKNAAWEKAPDIYSGQIVIAEFVLVNAITQHAGNVDPIWDARRRAALASLNEPAFRQSPLFGYLTTTGGFASPTHFELKDLDMGEPGPVSTNAAIISVSRQEMLAVDFFAAALEIINDRKSWFTDALGPENFATSLKFFCDKALEQKARFDGEALNTLKPMLERWALGFSEVTRRDTPNFVEITNICKAIDTLPNGVFPPEFTKDFIRVSLEALPDFTRSVIVMLLRAIGRLERDQAPRELALLAELSISMLGQLERTSEYRTALRSITNLKPSAATHNALRVVYNNAYRLHEPLDLGGLRDVTNSLRIIADRSIDDVGLTIQTQNIAEECGLRAINMYKQLESQSGEEGIDADELKHAKALVDQIILNWGNISTGDLGL